MIEDTRAKLINLTDLSITFLVTGWLRTVDLDYCGLHSKYEERYVCKEANISL